MKENKLVIIVSVCVILIIACGIFFLRQQEENDGRKFRGGGPPGMMNFTEEEMENMRPPDGLRENFTSGMIPDEDNINKVSLIFESGDPEKITAYCEEHFRECGYYCRNIKPENEVCEEIRLTRR